MKIRRRNQFKDKSYLRHLDCLFWTILSYIRGLKYRHFRQDNPLIPLDSPEITNSFLNRLFINHLGRILNFTKLHKTLLISKSLGVEK